MFYIGQEVVCINTDSITNDFPLKKGAIVTIKGILNCCQEAIDVGLTTSQGCKCYRCGDDRQNDTRWWLHSIRFAPVISNEELQRLLNEIEEPIVACV